MRLRISHKDLSFACSSAVLLILSLPKFDLGTLAWVGLVPLLVALDGKSLKRAFFLSYITGLIFFAGITYWIWSVPAFNLLDFLLLAAYLPHYVSLWGLGLNWIRRTTNLPAALVAPPLWVTLEYIRSHLSFLSFPWMLLGHSQYLHPSLTQISSLTGVYGLSFLIVLMNAAIAGMIPHVPRRWSEATTSSPFPRSPLISLTVAGLLLIASFLYGFFLLARGIEGERIPIALVQGNVPQEPKWDRAYRETTINRYTDLTKLAAQRAPMLIIWPETAVAGDVQNDPELKRKVAQVALDTTTSLLVGSSESAKSSDTRLRGKYYNSMFLFSPEGTIEGQYRKIALVPFAEYPPLQGLVKWPAAIMPPIRTTQPGDQYTLFSVGQATFGTTICWENIFPDLFREFVKRGARFMVNATNEAWFPEAAASYQQLLAMTTFRAAENRVAIARAANSGISALIDPFGRITHRLAADQRELFVEGVLIGDIPISRETTFYTQHGDIFAFIQIAFCLLLVLYCGVKTQTTQGRMPLSA